MYINLVVTKCKSDKVESQSKGAYFTPEQCELVQYHRDVKMDDLMIFRKPFDSILNGYIPSGNGFSNTVTNGLIALVQRMSSDGGRTYRETLHIDTYENDVHISITLTISL